MVNGSDEIGVRASIWSNDFMLGEGPPGGVRLPWGKAEGKRMKSKTAERKLALVSLTNGHFIEIDINKRG